MSAFLDCFFFDHLVPEQYSTNYGLKLKNTLFYLTKKECILFNFAEDYNINMEPLMEYVIAI